MSDNALRWFFAISLGAAVYVMAKGSDAGVFDQEYVKPPTRTRLDAIVIWSTQDEIKSICQKPLAYGCTVTGNKGPDVIYALKPRSFSDRVLVEALGHEVLHNLGATHQ